MVRMLFLRDIDTDVDIRCRDCGHGGVLGRAMLVRRFGASYPVLSIAPHYRCSRCDSRDTECRPAQPPEPAAAPRAGAVDDGMGAFDATLAALRGMIGAAHDSRSDPVPPAGRDAGDGDPDDTVVRPPAREPLWDELAEPPAPPEEEAGRDRRQVEPEEEPEEEPEPAMSGFPPGFAALFERAYADDPEEDVRPPPRDRPVFSMDWDDEATDDEATGGNGDEGGTRADPRDRAPDAPYGAEEESDPTEAEILSFAIRDRDEDTAPRNRRSAMAAEVGDADATLSMQKTLAALRGMIETAAAEPGDVPPAPKGSSRQPPDRPEAAAGASLDDTLAKLRGLLDLDPPAGGDGRDGDRPPGGRRR